MAKQWKKRALLKLEAFFNLYKPTMRHYMTSYYMDVERIGRLSGEYQHRDVLTSDWVYGPHPIREEEC